MAWLQKLTDVAILIVPMNDYAVRIGENICNYERLVRELPYLRDVMQLPILIVGFKPSTQTTTFNLKHMAYKILSDKNISDKKKYAFIKKKVNRDRNIQALFYKGMAINEINETTPIDADLIPKNNRKHNY